jgi:hypothetical protein
MVKDLGFRGLGFRVWGLGFRVEGLGLTETFVGALQFELEVGVA